MNLLISLKASNYISINYEIRLEKMKSGQTAGKPTTGAKSKSPPPRSVSPTTDMKNAQEAARKGAVVETAAPASKRASSATSGLAAAHAARKQRDLTAQEEAYLATKGAQRDATKTLTDKFVEMAQQNHQIIRELIHRDEDVNQTGLAVLSALVDFQAHHGGVPASSGVYKMLQHQIKLAARGTALNTGDDEDKERKLVARATGESAYLKQLRESMSADAWKALTPAKKRQMLEDRMDSKKNFLRNVADGFVKVAQEYKDTRDFFYPNKWIGGNKVQLNGKSAQEVEIETLVSKAFSKLNRPENFNTYSTFKTDGLREEFKQLLTLAIHSANVPQYLKGRATFLLRLINKGKPTKWNKLLKFAATSVIFAFFKDPNTGKQVETGEKDSFGNPVKVLTAAVIKVPSNVTGSGTYNTGKIADFYNQYFDEPEQAEDDAEDVEAAAYALACGLQSGEKVNE